ncbi:polyprenyl synthetase family protein [Traorella massiliensis]|uniref:polyprenyl synthetase family protein n=1 Tax=Traorella massiliensis TaxID=1903263 RepID=UPI0008F92946|nr:farnesyl diphosphate synthase [Traorella massiliensis]
MHDFENKLAHSLDHLEDSKVKQAMLYSLCAPAKRLRPQLLYGVLKAYGANESQGDRCAIAIEMIHTYSLIHDDLPCMDNDDLRRGQKTCHKQFDEATALLAGDALLSEAFGYVASATYQNSINNDLASEFVKAIGANGMILGQMIDLLSENVKTDLDTISKIDLLKTGCLFSLALVCGCLIANKKGDIEVWRNIGYKAGLAFQIQDDCLDVISSEEKLGKSISDEKNQKSTFVSELGFEKAQKLYLQYFDEIENDLKKCNIHSEPILKIFQMIKNRDH